MSDFDDEEGVDEPVLDDDDEEEEADEEVSEKESFLVYYNMEV